MKLNFRGEQLKKLCEKVLDLEGLGRSLRLSHPHRTESHEFQ